MTLTLLQVIALPLDVLREVTDGLLILCQQPTGDAGLYGTMYISMDAIASDCVRMWRGRRVPGGLLWTGPVIWPGRSPAGHDYPDFSLPVGTTRSERVYGPGICRLRVRLGSVLQSEACLE